MIPGLKTLSLILVLFLGFFVRADEPLLICKNKKVVRTIRITKENGLCKTNYSKDGKSQMIGSGLNPASCQKILEGVRKNLEASNWSCREAKATSFSDIEEVSK